MNEIFGGCGLLVGPNKTFVGPCTERCWNHRAGYDEQKTHIKLSLVMDLHSARGEKKYFCMARYWWQDAFSPIWLIVCQCCTSLGENPLAFLRTQPQFLHMRQAIQQNPAMLPALLQQLGRENPQLLQVTHSIYSHRELYTCTHEINVKCLVFINNPASHFYGMLFATRHTQLHLEEVLFIHLMDRSIVTSFR